MSHLKITGKPPRCRIEIDGLPVDLMALDLHLDAESLPQATVLVPAISVDVDTEATVRVDERTARTLLALGWTPPVAAGAASHGFLAALAAQPLSAEKLDRLRAELRETLPGE